MIGPSSSHTAGAVRLGRVAKKLMGAEDAKKLTIILSGSFAKTYRGHGTDRALLAGIMGFHSYDIEIRDALEIAKKRGIDYEFVEEEIPDAHPNTTRIIFETPSGVKGDLMGASIGGGNIRVDYVNGLKVNFTGDNTTMLVLHNDVPGVIADVTNLLRAKYKELNISNFRLSRNRRGGTALMTIEFDQEALDSLKEDVEKLDNVQNVVVIRAL